MKSNVTTINQPRSLTPEQISHRILAAVRATNAFHVRLVSTDKRMRDLEKAELGDATKAYREIVRDADDRGDALTPAESHVILPKVCTGLREHDRILDENKAARKARAAERERVEAAMQELMGPTSDGAQQQLPTVDQTGLAWFSADAIAVTYTALLAAAEREEIDAPQTELLAELAGQGLEAIKFVIDAAEAVGEDEDEDEGDPDVIADLDELADLPV